MSVEFLRPWALALLPACLALALYIAHRSRGPHRVAAASRCLLILHIQADLTAFQALPGASVLPVR